MRSLTLAELATITGGEAHGDPETRIGPDVVIDSRRATPGALFVALPGEHVDGHDYVTAAAEGGAAAALATRLADPAVPTVIVPDAVDGLAALAHALVTEARQLSVAGITGSSGKTSTKDLVAQVLGDAAPTVAPQGSFNNEIGVPLTATAVNADTRYLVSEMGARGLGHVAHLCDITPPHVAVVLNVGHAHLGEFGSREVIARAKGELVEAATDWVVLNADDPWVAGMVDRRRPGVRVAWFGLGETPPGDCAVTAEDITLTADGGHRFTLTAGGRHWSVDLQLAGRHQVANAVAAVATAVALGVPIDDAVASLDRVRPVSRWRMELVPRPDEVLIINDSYNANPDSMAAALAATAEIATRRREKWSGLRIWAVLGDMLELGPGAREEHRAVAARAQDAGVDHLIALGEFAPDMVDAGRAAGIPDCRTATGHAAAVAAVRPGPGDIVVVKASRGLELDKVAEALAEEVTG